ncbi:RNA methyltransferase [Candidatus Poribacteria bacterium]|nr:RNA methyltransferase [Candidatus Poribacteria bacterium]MYG05576.1 RNA methyltransferase [Candidatus Poribacteria bacterium]MYK24795.1 RNA methyltransferase [Candidatus Poribacteria bacterium]
MINYDEVIAFLEKENPDATVVSHFKQAYHTFSKTGEWHQNYQVLTAGWQKFDGVLLMTQGATFDTDYQVYLTAMTERSLRELLLAFPRRCSGMFHLTEKWMDNGIHDVLEGEFVHTDDGRFYRGIKRGSAVVEQRTISKRKDAVAADMRKLATLKGKLEYSQFVVEGDLMVERAIRDGLPIERILYTTALFETSEGQSLLKRASADNISCYQVNHGVMGSVTTNRPVPPVIASVYFNFRHFLSESGQPNFHFSPGCTILIAENIVNPDNLGMTLRTADAVGVSAVLLSHIGASPFHKNCVRASRGAVGRLPLYYATDIGAAIETLRLSGWSVLGGTSNAEKELYTTKFSLPTAVVVGNENMGLSPETRASCTELVRIPMASGQSSLNVGVAAGVLLYEVARQCSI